MSETNKAESTESDVRSDTHEADADANVGTEEGAASSARASAAPEDGEDERELLPRGNPLRRKRGLLITLAGAIPAFLLMAKNGQNAWGVPVGFLFIAVCAFGLMDLLGTFDDDDAQVATTTTLGALGSPILQSVAWLGAFLGSLALAQAAVGPGWLGSVTVPLTFIGLVTAVFNLGRRLGPWDTDELGLERPLFHRHGFWVVAIGALLYFPAMGVQSLWDPWETHYGEVAREILARDDWISLWWAQDGWFWSKPILNFWIQSLAMATLGTHYQPDQMLIGAGGVVGAHPEWAVRTPNVLMTIFATYLLYKGVAKVFGRRAGLLGAFVLATMPDWFFLAHQTMTDMPFVAAMTAAMGLLLFGLNTDEEAQVKVYEVRAFGARFRVSLWHLVFGAVLLCALPQIFYLFSRNLELVLWGDGPKGFRCHADEFRSGSAGNCGLPGNEACASHVPATLSKGLDAMVNSASPRVRKFAVALKAVAGAEPWLQGLVWAGLLGTLLYINWGERRARRIVYVAAWLAAAIATMAKGPAGFGLPIICAFAYVATKKRWSEILRLELLSGLLIILAVAMPWYVAMYIRHGSPFTDRLIFHDMFNRAFSHVHDTNEGDDTGIRYYTWQLGYAIFPWTGLAPLALLWGFRRSDSALSRALGRFGLGPAAGAPAGEGAYRTVAERPVGESGAPLAAAPPANTAVGDASVMLVMWFLFAFALFSFMGTKFHHYIFPAVPPIAMLVGVVLDDVLGPSPLTRPGKMPFYAATLGVATTLATYGAIRLWPGSLFGAKNVTEAHVALGVALLLVAVALAVRGVTWWREVEGEAPKLSSSEARTALHERSMFGAAAVAGALVVLLVGRDLSIKPEGTEQPGAIRLLQLFTYNYKRAWPDSLDFGAVLAGFTLVAALLLCAMAVRTFRRHAIAAFVAFAMLWAVWGLDVYMVKLSPHWGQREVIEAYYKDRSGPDEALVAYQMNWKGENFYTSNKIPAFVSTGSTYQNWLKAQREKGTKVIYLVTEHSRIGGLRSETGAKAYREITDKTLNNKFILIRAEL